MKVLHVIPAVAPRYGGPSHAVLEMCRELMRRGIEAEIATTNADTKNNLDTPLEKMVLYDGVPIYFFKRTLRGEYKFSWPMTRWLGRHLTDYHLLHIHSIFGYPSTLAAYLARRHRIPYILRPLGMLDDWPLRQNRFMKMIYLHLIEKASLNHARILHYTSEEEKIASEKLGLSAPGIVIPLGVSVACGNGVSKKGEFRSRYPSCQGKRLIVFLSRIHPKKGLELLIESLSKLQQVRDDFVFVIAGSGEAAYEEKIRQEVKRHSLTSKTIFTGFLQGETKTALLRDADLFVLLSYQENFGLSIVEAMAMGTPVLLTRGIHTASLIEKRRAGAISDYDSDELMQQIHHLLGDEQLRNEFGENAKNLVLEQFSWDVITPQIVNLYESILAGKRR